ncbi:MAG: hypothetical protein PW790_11000 [Parvibaculaceae bacterium]|nr:hypothetical protein [Parvibaculaceae bacterium]
MINGKYIGCYINFTGINMENRDSYKYSLSRVSEYAYKTDPGSIFPKPLIARILAHQMPNSFSVANIPVTFVSSTDEENSPKLRRAGSQDNFQGSVMVYTDQQGFAAAEALAGNSFDDFTVLARQPDSIGSPVTYILQTTRPDLSADVDSLQITSGDAQIAFPGDAFFPNPLQVKALNKSGNPVETATINFQIGGVTTTTFGNGKLQTSESTGSGGLTSPLVLIPGTTPALFKATASCNGNSVTFDLALAPARSGFSFNPADGNSFAIQIGSSTNRRISLLDENGTGWPSIICNAVISPDSNISFSPSPQDAGHSGPLATDEQGQINLPPITAKNVIGGSAQLTVETEWGTAAAYSLVPSPIRIS